MSTSDMTERQGVEIDDCPECRGVWLDRGELDKILERSDAEVPAPPRHRWSRSRGALVGVTTGTVTRDDRYR